MYTYKDFEFNQADWYQKGNKVFPQKSSGSSPTKKQETAKKGGIWKSKPENLWPDTIIDVIPEMFRLAHTLLASLSRPIDYGVSLNVQV